MTDGQNWGLRFESWGATKLISPATSGHHQNERKLHHISYLLLWFCLQSWRCWLIWKTLEKKSIFGYLVVNQRVPVISED
jgi:hypothetical protein